MKPSAVIWSWGWWKPGCWELNCVDVMTRLINVEMKASLTSQRGIFSNQWMLFQIWKDLQTRNLNHSFFAVGGDCCAGQQTADVRFCNKKPHRTLRLNRSRALAAVRAVRLLWSSKQSPKSHREKVSYKGWAPLSNVKLEKLISKHRT